MPNSTNQVRGTERVADMWNQKGSWVLLFGVALAMFMAGSSFQAWTYTEAVQTLQTSFDKKETEYKDRIRALNDELKELIPQVKVAATTAKQAADTVKATTEAAQNGKDNSEAGGK